MIQDHLDHGRSNDPMNPCSEVDSLVHLIYHDPSDLIIRQEMKCVTQLYFHELLPFDGDQLGESGTSSRYLKTRLRNLSQSHIIKPL